MKSEHHWFTAKWTVSSSMCPPFFPMVYLLAIYTPEDTEKAEEDRYIIELIPVVAIRSEVARIYKKRLHRDTLMPEYPPDEKEMGEDGWSFEGEEHEVNPIVVDSEYGVIQWDEGLLLACNSVAELITIPRQCSVDLLTHEVVQRIKWVKQAARDKYEADEKRRNEKPKKD